MAPPVEAWTADQLPTRVMGDVHDRRRKGGDIDLAKCEMLEMLQYSCVVEGSERGEHTRESVVRCTPIARLFRRCQDRKGSFMVETTAWETEERK
ncbi:hypothetical protein V495_06212 [Pseudogymnoascus sp. VKM F-4514 (FW-929)]|nr:hypothetical protein V490_06516 [Pseudogymnoascus sp. VKM F-3557]KFY39027.1 hypothetical protein V495_06212 [Pseudogymnoascus sp. VKM F-4514 (FW-929)]KFY65499.1 hypothetical protein V497_01376 [Pseudogymnoascus sp. VKM F-4516 (FW-969)]